MINVQIIKYNGAILIINVLKTHVEKKFRTRIQFHELSEVSCMAVIFLNILLDTYLSELNALFGLKVFSSSY